MASMLDGWMKMKPFQQQSLGFLKSLSLSRRFLRRSTRAPEAAEKSYVETAHALAYQDAEAQQWPRRSCHDCAQKGTAASCGCLLLRQVRRPDGSLGLSF